MTAGVGRHTTAEALNTTRTPSTPRLPAGKLKETMISMLYYEERALSSNTIVYKTQQRIQAPAKSILNLLTQLTKEGSLTRIGIEGQYRYHHPDVLPKGVEAKNGEEKEQPLDDADRKVDAEAFALYTGKDEPTSEAQRTPEQQPQAPDVVAPTRYKKLSKKALAKLASLEDAEAAVAQAPSAARVQAMAAPFLSLSLKIGPFTGNLAVYIDTPNPAERTAALEALPQLAERAGRILDLLSAVESQVTKANEDRDLAMSLAETAETELRQIQSWVREATPFLAKLMPATHSNGAHPSNGHAPHEDVPVATEA